MKAPHLIITPSVPVWAIDNAFIFDRKFYDGMLLYTQKWSGSITCIMSLSSEQLPEFGVVTIESNQLPFTCIALKNKQTITSEHLQAANIVLASGDADNQLHLSQLCQQQQIKCIYIIEYIPETRYQIADLSTKNPIIRLRRFFYIWQKERKRVAAFKLCDGLQSNGTPAYSEYHYVPNKLLYFDTRVFKEQIINNAALEQRLTYLSENKPLRLAFSGRLIQMKGAGHLVELAVKLKQTNIPFQLIIYGKGDMEMEMQEYIEKHHLNDQVSMVGVVDFYKTLIPELQQSIDVFVCLHRQSDPSCTYLETLSCGVPIVGYKNRAFAGLLELADIGWGGELNNLDEICRIIAHLHENRVDIVEKSKNSVAFAKEHDFDTTFQKRIDHLISTVDKLLTKSQDVLKAQL
jgi:glycosyltransferase involved in cell wall biosynthesis